MIFTCSLLKQFLASHCSDGFKIAVQHWLSSQAASFYEEGISSKFVLHDDNVLMLVKIFTMQKYFRLMAFLLII